MKIVMEFNKDKAEKIVAIAMNVSVKKIREMSDKELIEKAFQYASAYGFCNMKIID